MEEIIVIRAADPDGSLFRAVVDTLRDRSGRRVEVIPLVSHVLRIGELEIHHAHRRVLMAGREVQLNMGNMPCSTVWLRHLAASTPENNFMRRPGTRYIPMGQIPWKTLSSGYDRK